MSHKLTTHKKKLKYDLTILLLKSSVEMLFYKWFQTFKLKTIYSVS